MMKTLFRVMLTDQHRHAYRAKCGFDMHSSWSMGDFTSLEIAKGDEDPGYFLLYLSTDGHSADTWHESIDDAFHQAVTGFQIQLNEWTRIDEAN